MFRTFAGAAILAIAAPTAADAQIVSVGPLGGVSVRAPFTSVDVSPWGDTQVRAPFTAVNAPGRRFPRLRGRERRPLERLRERRRGAPSIVVPGGYPYGPRHYGTPAPLPESYPVERPPIIELPRPEAPRYHIPSYSEVFPESAGPSGNSGQAPDLNTRDLEPPEREAPNPEAPDSEAIAQQRLAERLRSAAERLQRSLAAREEDGQMWQDYLRPEEIAELAEDFAQSQEVSVAQARALLTNLDAVAANPTLSDVTRLGGFSDARRALSDLIFVLDPDANPQAADSGERAASDAPRSDELPDDIVPPAGDIAPPAGDIVPPAGDIVPPANNIAPPDGGDAPAVEGESLPAPMPDPQPVFRGEV